MQRTIFTGQSSFSLHLGGEPFAPVSVNTYVDGCFYQECVHILYEMGFPILVQPQISGMKKIFCIKAPTDPDADLSHQAVPYFTTDIYIRHICPERTQSRISFLYKWKYFW